MVVRLPGLIGVRGVSLCRLPLSASGADRCIAALLTDDANARFEQLGALLAAEPALTLWCLCQSGGWKNSPPTSLAEVADWLAVKWRMALRWPDNELATVTEATPEQCQAWTRLRWAEQQAGAATFAQARQWLLTSCDSVVPELESLLPAWLLIPDTSHEAPLTGVGTSSADSPYFAESSSAAMLPHLVRKLARLAELETEFAPALEREKLAALKELAYGASHEINNPLANISTRAQALLRDETDPERRRKLATINSQAFRAHEMISDMMLFAKPPRLVCEQFDLARLIDNVLGELGADAREQGTLLSFANRGQAVVIDADRGQLAVALKALASNALEALGCGGRVDFSVESISEAAPGGDCSGAKIVVTDTGPGISQSVRRHLFDPFYSGREAGRGLGFGLAKCWRIVTDHGGRIDVESEVGKGARFTICLPGRAQERLASTVSSLASPAT